MVNFLLCVGLGWVVLVALCALFFAGGQRVQSS
jgi:hypothetical protein